MLAAERAFEPLYNARFVQFSEISHGARPFKYQKHTFSLNLAYSLNEAHGYKLNSPYPFGCIWIAKYFCATKLQREFVLP